ncbi:Protein of unknown function [Pyronema omphalodes CBS 100304]|uniref:Uncharacterized protein n=1 Tax=Pyronema omphalodes (strain CBS 100304) TaxID=1076935 RepID=U4KZR7_PYROM|nr:Protein of unknown function [Pyronema omphalodes CBS 100304]
MSDFPTIETVLNSAPTSPILAAVQQPTANGPAYNSPILIVPSATPTAIAPAYDPEENEDELDARHPKWSLPEIASQMAFCHYIPKNDLHEGGVHCRKNWLNKKFFIHQNKGEFYAYLRCYHFNRQGQDLEFPCTSCGKKNGFPENLLDHMKTCEKALAVIKRAGTPVVLFERTYGYCFTDKKNIKDVDIFKHLMKHAIDDGKASESEEKAMKDDAGWLEDEDEAFQLPKMAKDKIDTEEEKATKESKTAKDS